VKEPAGHFLSCTDLKRAELQASVLIFRAFSCVLFVSGFTTFCTTRMTKSRSAGCPVSEQPLAQVIQERITDAQVPFAGGLAGYY